MSNSSHHGMFDSWEMWLGLRSHRERICILVIGWIVIAFFWYESLFKPLKLERIHIAQQTSSILTQIDIFKKEVDKVTKEGEARITAQQRLAEKSKGAPKIEWATSSDIDVIVKQILNTGRNIEFVSLKTNSIAGTTSTPNATAGNMIELTFNSNYFDTISYLEQLEKIPWCLAWDSIEYKVTTYPNAVVTIRLSIASNE